MAQVKIKQQKLNKFLFERFPQPTPQIKFHLKPKNHVELLSLKPWNSVGVLCHGKGFSSNPKHEPPDLHDPEPVQEPAHTEDDLPKDDDECEEHSSQSNSENPNRRFIYRFDFPE